MNFRFKLLTCPRCGAEHDVSARMLRGQPILGMNAMATCPTFQEPILMTLEVALSPGGRPAVSITLELSLPWMLTAETLKGIGASLKEHSEVSR